MTTPLYHIYGLIDPRSHELYYVGKTRRALHDRIDEHFFETSETLVSKKNHAIIQSGAFPHILLLDTAGDEITAFHKELHWIHLFAGQGRGLKNREAQAWFLKRYEEAFGSQDSKTSTPASRTPPRGRKSIPALKKETYHTVQALCATLDTDNITELEATWRAWLNTPGKTPPKNPDAAFIAFCKRKLEG